MDERRDETALECKLKRESGVMRDQVIPFTPPHFGKGTYPRQAPQRRRTRWGPSCELSLEGRGYENSCESIRWIMEKVAGKSEWVEASGVAQRSATEQGMEWSRQASVVRWFDRLTADQAEKNKQQQREELHCI